MRGSERDVLQNAYKVVVTEYLLNDKGRTLKTQNRQADHGLPKSVRMRLATQQEDVKPMRR